MPQAADKKNSSNSIASPLLRFIAGLGAFIIRLTRRSLSIAGGMVLLFGETAIWTVSLTFNRLARTFRKNLFEQMVRVGIRAIPIVILIELAIGMILPLQMFPKLDQFGQGDQIATINAIAAFRELGPLMTAIVLSGFAGASIAAELGTMVTSEEIEALKTMALNPVSFLVVPRLLATIIMTVMLSVIADIVMVFGGWITSIRLGLDSHVYYQMSKMAVDLSSFGTGLVKAGVFGLLIGLIACYLGLAVKPWQGSNGVGLATTNTVVYSIVAIVGADAVFTVIFYAYGLF